MAEVAVVVAVVVGAAEVEVGGAVAVEVAEVVVAGLAVEEVAAVVVAGAAEDVVAELVVEDLPQPAKTMVNTSIMAKATQISFFIVPPFFHSG